MKKKKIIASKLAGHMFDVILDHDTLHEHLELVIEDAMNKSGFGDLPDDENDPAYNEFVNICQILNVLTASSFKKVLTQAIRDEMAKTTAVKSGKVIVV